MSDYHTLLPIISAWLADGKAVAMATVLQTWHSAPRQAGAKLCVSDAGDIAGSVSGGCVEAGVIETALQVIKSGEAQTLHFGVADDTALAVGLACGGEIAIHVEVYEETLHEHIEQQIAQHTPFSIWTQLTTSQHILVQDNHVVYSSQNQLFNMASTCDETTYNAEKGWFYERVQAPFRLVIVGGNHISMALAQSVILLKWHIILIDPRTAFANQARFPDVHQIINTYPQKAL
ncbi:MAG: XdhC family protein, partial [Chloroflexota bacterium]